MVLTALVFQFFKYFRKGEEGWGEGVVFSGDGVCLGVGGVVWEGGG